MTNGVQLLAYADRLGDGGLRGLRELLNGPFDGLFDGVHVLPFYHPIDGADTGFDPIDHLRVDERLGDWEDLRALSAIVEVTADLIVNHISAESAQFLDYLQHGDNSPHAGMFLSLDKVFPDGDDEHGFSNVYRPRPTEPYAQVELSDGSERRLWTTFTSQQIDIDVFDPGAQRYLKDILKRLAENGIKTVRLDAVGYAVKTPGTSCFMTKDTYTFLRTIVDWTHERGMRALAEIHAYYRYQQEAARHVDYVYDFALPPLLLHSLFESTAAELKDWFAICPQNAITVLDTHDGIGVMDVGPDAITAGTTGLIPDLAIDSLVEKIHRNSDGVSRAASRQDVGNLDLYQVNCTYYDALGRNDRDYLLARLVQLFAPGIPQIYYVGLFAGENDTEQLERTRSGRDVNRRFYSSAEIERELERPVVRSLLGLIRFRNRHDAFAGTFELIESPDHVLHIRRINGSCRAELRVDFEHREFEVQLAEGDSVTSVSDFGAFQAS